MGVEVNFFCIENLKTWWTEAPILETDRSVRK